MRVDIDYKGIAELSRDPRLGDQMMPAARACRDEAKLKAPYLSGTYKRSIFAAKLARGNGAFYGSSDRKAVILEFGARPRHKAFHTLRNAALKHRLNVVEIARALP